MSKVMEIPVNSTIHVFDEILLESGFEENAAPHTQLIELSQVSLLKSYSVHFTLYDRHFLSVYSKTFFSKPKRYWLNLAYLEPTPIRHFKVDRPSLYATGILSLVAMVFILVNAFVSEPLTMLPVTAGLTCSAAITFLLLIYRSKDRVVFYSRYGRVIWLEFLINKPNRRAYREFVEVITKAIQAVSSGQNSRHEQRLGAELREHRRLREARILSSKVYEDVKSRFLSQHANLQGVFVEDDDLDTRARINISNLRFISKKVYAYLAARMAELREQIKKKKLQAKK